MSTSFEYYFSLPFWAALAAVTAVVRPLRVWPRVRAGALLAASVVLLLAIPRFGLRELALVLGLSLFSLAAAWLLRRPDLVRAPAGRRAVFAAGVLGVLAFLAFFKLHVLQAWLLPARDAASPYLFLIGVSYFSFRALHVLIETYRGNIREVDPLHFLVYMTFFPSFICGPIDRYPPFAAQLGAPGPAGTLGRDLRAGGERIVHGLFKKFVLAALLGPYRLGSVIAPGVSTPAALGAMAATALYFYVDFSAYSDLAIGSARVMGFTLPENFDRPFFQRNIRDLWSAWHMSLTKWLVDYVYWPVVQALRRLEWFRTRPVALSMVGMNATFLACGAWHGEGLHFLLWGAYHGTGISVATAVQRLKRRVRSPALQRYFTSRASRVVGMVGTFAFFSVGIALFALDLRELSMLLSSILQGGPAR